ncbi:phosphoglycerate dehydrogenase [Desulfatiferula olefinivorans]
MKTILVTTSSFGKEQLAPIGTLESGAYRIVENPFGRKLSEDEVSGLIGQYAPVGMIAGVEPLNRRVLEKAAGLKIISRCGIGLDSVDLDAARELGIAVTNTPDAPTVPVAELTIGLMLSLLRKIHLSDRGIRNRRWERPMGGLLQGKTVGIVGCGRIGTYVGALLTGFGCRMLGSDPGLDRHDGLTLVSLDALLKESDIVSLHLPYSPSVHHIMNRERLLSMKQGALLVNASRGGLVDEEALFFCLKQEHLAGAAIDCFEHEPYQGPLADRDDVVLTGHIGSYAKEGREIMERQAVENLVKGLMTLKTSVNDRSNHEGCTS